MKYFRWFLRKDLQNLCYCKHCMKYARIRVLHAPCSPFKGQNPFLYGRIRVSEKPYFHLSYARKFFWWKFREKNFNELISWKFYIKKNFPKNIWNIIKHTYKRNHCCNGAGIHLRQGDSWCSLMSGTRFAMNNRGMFRTLSNI